MWQGASHGVFWSWWWAEEGREKQVGAPSSQWTAPCEEWQDKPREAHSVPPPVSGDSIIKYDVSAFILRHQLMVNGQRVSGKRWDSLSCRATTSPCLLLRTETSSYLVFQVLCGSVLQQEWSWWVLPPWGHQGPGLSDPATEKQSRRLPRCPPAKNR